MARASLPWSYGRHGRIAPQRGCGTRAGASGLEDIEQDLDTVDEALAALDSGDLEEAEALAAELDAPSTDPSGDGSAP